MRFQIFLLCLLAGVFSTETLAGVGQTSSGVTTTGGQNPNDPSADVQQQSSGFVQQNQQQQNATPGATGSAPAVATAQGGPTAAAGAQNGNKTDPALVNGVPVAVPPAAPAVPPPPPPVYESTMRRLDRHTDTTPTVVASGPPGAVRKQDPAEPAKPAHPPTPTPAPVVKVAPNTPAVTRTETATVAAAPERLTPPAITGGRGEAPDGFTFYSGVSIAGALLAFAFATYLRMGRSEV